MVDLQRVNSSIGRQFRLVLKRFVLYNILFFSQALDQASDLVRYEVKKMEDQAVSTSDEPMFDSTNVNLITSLVGILQDISKSGWFIFLDTFLSSLKSQFSYKHTFRFLVGLIV